MKCMYDLDQSDNVPLRWSEFELKYLPMADRNSEQLGASYTTIPRLASRRTPRNFYQHNYPYSYPYSWVGVRVAYDV
jgi:hypothetical protein